MIELKKEQLKAAKLAATKATQYEYLKSEDNERWEIALTAAAPYLQSPWEMPTLAEANLVHDDLHRMSTCDALSLFVNRRNAALVPPPEDPRREKIMQAINSVEAFETRYNERVADAIVKVLDGTDGR